VLPQFESLQIEYGMRYRSDDDTDGFWSPPKCYFANYDVVDPQKSLIIMEDLSADGFDVQDKFVPSDFEHTRKLFVELGKLHGLSFALKRLKPQVFDEFRALHDLMCTLMTTDAMKPMAARNIELMASCIFSADERHVRDKILSYRDNLWQQMAADLDGHKAEPYGVICHGDCWTQNVLYNYESADSSEIKDIRLLDWQMTRFGSLASELWYYLFCCCDKTLRDQHQAELFRIHYDSMESMLAKFNINIIGQVFPSRSDYEQHLGKFGKFAFSMSSFAIPLLCKYPEKGPDDVLTDAEKECVSKYKARMRDIIEDMERNNIL